MTEKDYEIPFTVIMKASSAKEKFLLAVKEARNGNFENAEKMVSEGELDLREAHKTQTALIQAEARGEKTEFSIIFIHSQDHLTMALTIKDMAEEMIEGYKLFYKKEK